MIMKKGTEKILLIITFITLMFGAGENTKQKNFAKRCKKRKCGYHSRISQL